mmetsp:Transcript_28647/g.54851  ORF Transcript_28647/g.54851 Transcript_28647/m.54851 type:complete len:233 (-) Transcript_28647:1822-2520(-)
MLWSVLHLRRCASWRDPVVAQTNRFVAQVQRIRLRLRQHRRFLLCRKHVLGHFAHAVEQLREALPLPRRAFHHGYQERLERDISQHRASCLWVHAALLPHVGHHVPRKLDAHPPAIALRQRLLRRHERCQLLQRLSPARPHRQRARAARGPRAFRGQGGLGGGRSHSAPSPQAQALGADEGHALGLERDRLGRKRLRERRPLHHKRLAGARLASASEGQRPHQRGRHRSRGP